MGIQADWRLAELEAESDDPFDTVILTSGLSIDLTAGEDAVYDGLRQTLQIESRLFNRGVTCSLKDGGQDCLTCEEFSREGERAALCALGRDQRVIQQRCERLAAERNGPFVHLGNAYLPEATLADRAYRAAVGA